MTPNWNYSKKIIPKDLQAGLNNLKPGKAADADKIFPEFLINCGLRTKKWLVTLFSRIVHTSEMPPIFQKGIVIAILKPGKDGNDLDHFRPISLLCLPY